MRLRVKFTGLQIASMNKLLPSFLTFIFLSVLGFSQPVITSNPQNAVNCIDSCVLLDVAAVGNNLLYQWQQDTGSGFSDIGLAQLDNDTLHVCSDGLIAPSSADYRCVVFDANGDSAVSSSATVTLDSCLAPIADFYWDWSVNEICFTSTSLRAETLFWLFGDGATNSNNETQVCHTYTMDELYFVKLIVYNDFGQDEIEKGFKPLSVNEILSDFDVFPNPVNEKFSIQSSHNIDMVRVYGMTGSMLMSLTPNSANVNISMESLESGIYSVLINSNGETIQKRIVKR